MTNKVVLKDDTDTDLDYMLIFDNEVSLDNVKKVINEVKSNVKDYGNGDIFEALQAVSTFDLEMVDSIKL